MNAETEFTPRHSREPTHAVIPAQNPPLIPAQNPPRHSRGQGELRSKREQPGLQGELRSKREQPGLGGNPALNLASFESE